jgi:protein PhnA
MTDEMIVKDSNGTTLKSGDSVSVIKDLKVKGSSMVVKRGTTMKNIRLTSDDPTHIECGSGKNTLLLKTEFLKRV